MNLTIDSVKGTQKTNPPIGCTLLGVTIIDDSHIRLDVPSGESCDPQAAIKLAKSIVPGVTTVSTYHGPDYHAEYRFVDGEWNFIPRGRTPGQSAG